MKKAWILPRWFYLVMSMLTTAEGYSGIKQTWLKYKWREVLHISDSDIIGTGISAALFTALAVVGWYLWGTYHKRNHSERNLRRK